MHPEIEKLINIARENGELTENLRETILQKAEQLGEDIDDVDFIIEGVRRDCDVRQKVGKVMPSVIQSPNAILNNKSTPPGRKRLAIKKEGKLILGVCNGLADSFNIEPSVVRLSFLSAVIVIIVLRILHVLSFIPFILLLEMPPMLYFYLYYYLTKPNKPNNKRR